MTATTTPDPTGQSGQTTVPARTDNAGQTTTQSDNLPEKFKGKTAEDIAKSYIELEQKLGETSQSVNQTRQTLSQWEALGKVIQGNPALYNQIEYEIAKISGQVPNQQKTVDPKTEKLERDVVDTKLATQGSLIERFETQYGINKLPADKQKELQKKIGKEVLDMTGKEVSELPLDQLPKHLERAYKLLASEDATERARMQGILEARRNSEATFGNIPSGSLRDNAKELTSEEKKVAKRLGVKEEAYLKNKQEYAR